MKHFLLGLCFTLAACGGDNHPGTIPAPPVAGWEAGPTIKGYGNYSPGTILTETPDGLVIDIPQQGQGETEYITRAMSLAPGQCIDMYYRVEMADGVQIVPTSNAALPSMLSLYFQRRGDDWSMQGKFEAYRWYSPEIDEPITAGEHHIRSCLDENWTATETSSAQNNPAAFQASIANSSRVGFVLGGDTGRGHGVVALGGPARIVMTSFEVLP